MINDNLLRKKNILNITTTSYAACLPNGRNCLTLHTIHLPNMLEALHACLPFQARFNSDVAGSFILKFYFKSTTR